MSVWLARNGSSTVLLSVGRVARKLIVAFPVARSITKLPNRPSNVPVVRAPKSIPTTR